MKWKVDVEKSQNNSACSPARISIPLPLGSKPAGFSILSPDKKTTTAQHRVLTSWPDGSPRWVQLDFQVEKSGLHVVRQERTDIKEEQTLKIERSSGKLSVETGRLRVELDRNGRLNLNLLFQPGAGQNLAYERRHLIVAGFISRITQ